MKKLKKYWIFRMQNWFRSRWYSVHIWRRHSAHRRRSPSYI